MTAYGIHEMVQNESLLTSRVTRLDRGYSCEPVAGGFGLLTPEQRHHLYKMPRLRLAANEDGTAALDALPVLKSSNLDTLCLRSTRIR